MTTVFVTASGTDVGKTFVMCALIEELRRTDWRIRVLKPVATGFDPHEPQSTDTYRLLHAQGLEPTIERVDAVTPWRFATLPTRRSPSFMNETTEGVVLLPSALGMTCGSPLSTNATQELVVPKSIPMIFPILP